MPKIKRNSPVILEPGTPWAIEKEVFREILTHFEGESLEIIESSAFLSGVNFSKASPLIDRGNYAEVSLRGPITRYNGVFSIFSGSTSVEEISSALEKAGRTAEYRGVILNVNSPGGTVDGINELSGKIAGFSSRYNKPIVAYVGGQANSAAYWLASAAEKIIVNDTATVGSIGVYTTYLDNRKALKEAGLETYDIIASQSPKKIPDVSTGEGRAQVQSHIDSLAEIFISTVAKNRRTTAENVAENFGQGDIVMGKHAVEKGMADLLGGYDDARNTLFKLSEARLQRGTKSFKLPKNTQWGENRMEISTKEEMIAAFPEFSNAVREDGAREERERIKSIEELAGNEYQEVIESLKWDGKTDAKNAAVLILQSQKEGEKKSLLKREALRKARSEDSSSIPVDANASADDLDSEIEAEINKLKTAARSVSEARGKK